ncbi:hypothetical protein H4582DRAFT_240112 [Lactarius indigo]|nr:hypothetical protein H4582DRAFT_240112 [Lactarius indigo]
MLVLFDRWKKQYNPIFSFKIGTILVIVMNDLKATSDLLDKKGDIYSSRPRIVAHGSVPFFLLRCRGIFVGMRFCRGVKPGPSAPYGDHWRRWRKFQHDASHPTRSLYSLV